MEYRFLIDIDFDSLHQTFIEAFSDYFVPFRLTKEQLRDLMTRRGADLSLSRSRNEKISLGAFLNDRFVGYAIAFPSNGDIPQFAVERSFRRRGVGSALLNAVQSFMPDSTAARIINADYQYRSNRSDYDGLSSQDWISKFRRSIRNETQSCLTDSVNQRVTMVLRATAFV